MNPADEFRTLRNRLDGIGNAIDRADRDRPGGVPRFAGQVYNGGAIPTSVPKVYLTHPLALSATESEGSAPTLTPDTTRSVPVLVLGPSVPAAGDNVVARQVSGRWIAQHGSVDSSTPTTTLVGCSGCATIPTTLYLRINSTSFSSNIFKDCTLVYGPVPSGYSALGIGANAFISAETFLDQIGQPCQFFWTCTGTSYTLQRIYITSIFGSPFREVVRFTWSPAVGSSNTCSPFYLIAGTVFSGGDSRLKIEVKPTAGVYTGP